MYGESGDRDYGVDCEVPQCGLFENHAIGVEILDVVATELRNLRGVMRASRQQPLTHQPFESGLRGGSSHAVAPGHGRLGEKRSRTIDHGDDALAQGVVDSLGERGCLERGVPGRPG